MSKQHLQTFKQRALSWSSISSWEYDKEKWAAKYLDGIQDPPSKEMLFGNEVGGKLASDPTFLPDVPRYAQFEKKLEGKIGTINLLGFIDSFCPTGKHVHEYKTSSNVKKWNQKSVDTHGQLDFYLLLIYLNYKLPPESVNVALHYIPVEEGNDFNMKLSNAPIQSFSTKRSTMDIIKFGAKLKKTFDKMCKFAEQYPDEGMPQQ
jgi:hypothetical protein